MPLLAVTGIGVPRWPGGAAAHAQPPAGRRRHEGTWNRTECAIGTCWTRYLASRRGRRDKPQSSGRSRYDCGGLTGGERCRCRSELPQSQQHSKQPVYGLTHSGGLSAPVGASRPSSAVKPRRVLLPSRRKSALRPTCGWQWSPEHARGLCQS